jgi:autotransporter-associated beta strand protein
MQPTSQAYLKVAIRLLQIIFVAAACAWANACPRHAAAASFTWQVPIGAWNVSSNWAGAQQSSVPGVDDAAYLANGGTLTISSSAACATLNLGENSGAATVVLNPAYQLSATTEYIGDANTGTFSQLGGNNLIASNLFLGYKAIGTGSYQLSAGSLSSFFEYVGYSGSGSFTQLGGSNQLTAHLYLGYNSGSSGSYSLGGGSLSMVSLIVGDSGSGTFSQTGGANSVGDSVFLGLNAGSSCSYSLSSGSLATALSLVVGNSGSGTFSQSGGSNAVGGNLYLGYNPTSGGTYGLGGNGSLSAANEYVAYGGGSSALFQQTGGTNTTGILSIGSGGKYIFTGGSLGIGNAFTCLGTFDAQNGAGSLSFPGSAIADFSQGSILNTASTSLALGPNSLLILSASTNPATAFANYTNAGLVHYLGTVLTLSPGQGFGGSGTISDPVNCQGTITAIGGPISLTGGLTISGTGSVNLNATALGTSGGTLTTQDTLSGMTGGILASGVHIIASTGTALFTQSGGTNAITNGLYLGYNAGANGSYSLTGGLLTASTQTIGYSGSGTFTQTSGMNSVAGSVYLGYNTAASGSYSLSGGAISAGSLYVGYSGTGTLTQASGANVNAGALYIGANGGASGSYSFANTALAANYESIGPSGSGSLIQTGGTNSTGSLNVGGNGSYVFNGSGLITAGNENIGGTFQQTSGINSAGGLSIGGGGRYLLAGGSLAINGYSSSGTLDGGNSKAVLSFADSTIYNLAQGTIFNSSSLALSLAPDALVIVSPRDIFGTLGTLGIVHTAGTTLVVPAGQGFAGNGIITDPINCQGTITASGGPLLISAGLTLSGTGCINLDTTYGTLATEDTVSGMSGGSLFTAYHNVGYYATGTFTQSGGLSSPGYLYLGYLTAAKGSYVLSGGSLNSAYGQYVGINGTGSFTQSGGENTVGASSSLVIGYLLHSSGSYSLSGGSLSSDSQWLGFYGGGSFNQSGGSNAVAGTLSIGSNFAGSGSYSLSAGGLSDINQIVGAAGHGNFMQTGGTSSTTTSLTVGNNYGGLGTYSLTGGLLATPALIVGSSGTGSFTQSGGTNSIATSLDLGSYDGSQGTYNLGGGLLQLSGAGLISGSGRATFNFGSGTLQSASSWSSSMPIVLPTSGSNGTIDTDGNTLTLSGSLSGPGGLIKAGSGTLVLTAVNTFSGNTTIAGGTLQIDNPLALENSMVVTTSSPQSSNMGNLNLNGLNAVLGGLAGSGQLALGSGTLTIGNAGGTNVFAGSLNGNGSLIKLGSGMTTFSGSNSFLGTTSIIAGTLEAGTTASLPNLFAPSKVSVAAGAMLAVGVGGSQQWTGNDIANLLSETSFVFASSASLGIDTNGGNFTYAGVFPNTSPVLVKLGSNTLTLAGSNSNTAGITIDAGVLQLGGSAVLGGSANLLAVNGGTLDLNGYSPMFGLFRGNGTIDNLASTPVSLTVGTGNTKSTFSGTIQNLAGLITLVKVGTGSVTLAGTDTYTGGTQVTDGKLILDGAASLIAGSSLTIGSTSASANTVFAPSAASASTSLAPVPEPDTMILLATAVALMVTAYWRRRK